MRADGTLADLQSGYGWREREVERRRSERAAKLHTVICDVCGEPFLASQPTAKRHPAKDATHDCHWVWEVTRLRARRRS